MTEVVKQQFTIGMKIGWGWHAVLKRTSYLMSKEKGEGKKKEIKEIATHEWPRCYKAANTKGKIYKREIPTHFESVRQCEGEAE